ncbi:hypothetical protein BDY21DRAFT_420888 [Lineolata rhizophorae]|uniref:Uncharacterized protein n=1 Tax=Lineolata rhizophorae TaxID=578093 RepID=A0A6A6P356_9PEZI|nr:hypothetical protein BDY21DRAFT_420888 [Lineolata rhizophorae]
MSARKKRKVSFKLPSSDSAPDEENLHSPRHAMRPPCEPASADNEQANTLESRLPELSFDERNYLFQIEVMDTYKPTISRLMSMPPDLRFDQVFKAIEIAFGWAKDVPRPHVFKVCIFHTPPANLDDRLCWLELGDTNEYMETKRGGRMKMKEEECTLSDVYARDEEGETSSLMLFCEILDIGFVHRFRLLGRAEDGHAAQMDIKANTETGRVFCLQGSGMPAAEGCGGPVPWTRLKEAFRTCSTFKFPKSPGSDEKRDWEPAEWWEAHCSGMRGLIWDRVYGEWTMDPHVWEGPAKVNGKLQEAGL